MGAEFIFKAFPLKSILEMMIGYLSDLLESIAPSELSNAEKEKLQMYIGPFYALLKFVGKKLVADTSNDLDDKVVAEFVEVCEKFSVKYGVELNAKAV